MPNYVTNILNFEGDSEDIQKCLNSIKGIANKKYPEPHDYEVAIDFDKIIPQPESLNITSGTQTDRAVAILKNDVATFQNMLSWGWVKELNLTNVESVKNYLISIISEEAMEDGRKAIKNLEDYGYQDWYGWRTANWGTKWNACDIEKITPTSIKFDTAWSSPFPVMLKLSEMFPTLTLQVFYADEDIGSNCGSYTLNAGALISEYNPEGYEAMKFAYKTKGYDENVAIEYFGWIPLEELPKLKEDLVNHMNENSVELQKNIVDELIGKIQIFDNSKLDSETRVKFLIDTFVENELYEAAQFVKEKENIQVN